MYVIIYTMSVKIKAKNPTNTLQTLTCNSGGELNVAFDGLDLSKTNAKLDLNFGKLSNIQTITDTKLSAIQTFLDKDSGVNFHNTLTNSKLDTVITNTEKTITHLNLLNTTITANSFSSSINLQPYPSEGGHIWGNSDTHYNLILQYSNDNITYFNIKLLNVINIDSDLTFNCHLEIPPKYIRFHNPKNTDVSCNFFIDLIT